MLRFVRDIFCPQTPEAKASMSALTILASVLFAIDDYCTGHPYSALCMLGVIAIEAIFWIRADHERETKN